MEDSAGVGLRVFLKRSSCRIACRSLRAGLPNLSGSNLEYLCPRLAWRVLLREINVSDRLSTASVRIVLPAGRFCRYGEHGVAQPALQSDSVAPSSALVKPIAELELALRT